MLVIHPETAARTDADAANAAQFSAATQQNAFKHALVANASAITAETLARQTSQDGLQNTAIATNATAISDEAVLRATVITK
jgi:hypothetical protein